MMGRFLTHLSEITANALSPIAAVTLVGATVAIVGATALPSKASADGGTSDHDVSIQISDEDLIGDEDWLSDEDLIGDILRIGDAAPATSGGGHINHITRRIGPFFVYAAFDQYGHPVRNCKRMDYLPHYNINVKRNSDDPDNLSMLRFHVTPADQNKRVILYESKTKTCVDISKRNLKERIKKLTKQALKDMANSARYLWEQAPEWGVAALAFAIAVGAFIVWLVGKGVLCRWAC